MPYKIDKNIFGFMIPTYDYFALDEYNDKYIAISNLELKNCYFTAEKHMICKQTFPIYTSANTKICEIHLLKKGNFSEECHFRVSKFNSEMWFRLKEPNTFIYAFPKQQYVHITCGERKTERFLSGSGIIQIDPQCRIKTDMLIIKGIDSINTVKFREIMPSVKFNAEITKIIITIEKFFGHSDTYYRF